MPLTELRLTNALYTKDHNDNFQLEDSFESIKWSFTVDFCRLPHEMTVFLSPDGVVQSIAKLKGFLYLFYRFHDTK